jgi:methyl-accepting chemotaxis protein
LDGRVAQNALDKLRLMKINNFNWLEIAEYLSLSGAVMGSVATVVSQQVIYAAIPLSLSLVLNLFNRHRWEQLTRIRLTVAVTQLDQKLSSIKNLVDRRVEDLRTDIAQLNEEALKIQANQEADTLNATVLKLQQQIAAIEQSLESMSVQLEELTEVTQKQPLTSVEERPVPPSPVRFEEISPTYEPRREPQPQPEFAPDPQELLKRYHW